MKIRKKNYGQIKLEIFFIPIHHNNYLECLNRSTKFRVEYNKIHQHNRNITITNNKQLMQVPTHSVTDNK